MAQPVVEEIVVADVKCYYCGHISGRWWEPPRADAGHRFIPRPGYTGPEVKAGSGCAVSAVRAPSFWKTRHRWPGPRAPWPGRWGSSEASRRSHTAQPEAATEPPVRAFRPKIAQEEGPGSTARAFVVPVSGG